LDASTDIHELRKTLLERKRALTAAAAPAASDIDEVDHTIPTRDGNSITVRIYRTRETHGGPVMVMLHGGGWVLGGLDNEALLCRDWVEQCRGVAINVDYRLAPEAKFPVPIYDSYDALLWTASHEDVHKGDLRKGFIIAGISAGASMASTIAHLARDEVMQPPITGCYLSIPSLLAPQAVPENLKKSYLSREQHKDAPVLGQGAIALFRSMIVSSHISVLTC
jgi:acetyl esterase/lipase